MGTEELEDALRSKYVKEGEEERRWTSAVLAEARPSLLCSFGKPQEEKLSRHKVLFLC